MKKRSRIYATYMPLLIKFSMTGAMGTISNLVVFSLLFYGASLHHLAASTVAFIVAVTQNYIINKSWTFRTTDGEGHRKFIYYLRFVAVSLAGLSVNLGVLFVLVDTFGFKYVFIAQFMGILGGMMINFTGSVFFVFSQKKWKAP